MPKRAASKEFDELLKDILSASKKLDDLLQHGPPAKVERLRRTAYELMKKDPQHPIRHWTPHEAVRFLEQLQGDIGATGGKRSGESRAQKRCSDLDSAASALNRLRAANDVKRYRLADIAAESGLPLPRLQSLTLSEIRAHARKK